MNTANCPSQSPKKRRKFLFTCAILASLYPFFRFLGFSIPKKPRIIEVAAPLPLGGFHLGPDYILFDDGKQAWAVSRRCTHLGCTINFREKEHYLECPCHQSRFSPEGLVLHGPAERKLPRYQVEKLKDNGGYIITI